MTVSNNQDCIFNSIANTLACAEQIYRTVTIGNQIWLAENLNVGSMVHGGDYENAQSDDGLVEKFCMQDVAEKCSNGAGGLYQWAEAMGLPSVCNDMRCDSLLQDEFHQGLCPNGWHIPRDFEWDTLATILGGDLIAGSKMKIANSGDEDWDALKNNDGNTSGFSAMNVGSRYSGGGFLGQGYAAEFWEASDSVDGALGGTVRDRSLSSFNQWLYKGSRLEKISGCSVRCIMDNH